MIRVSDNHAARLLRLSPGLIAPAMGAEMAAAAQAIVETARQHINDGAISGAGHVRSLPGEYPNSDTHVLEQSLHTGELVAAGDTIQTSAIADAPYAGYLELGTSRMEPRPYMTPATEEVRPTVLPALEARFIEIVNG